MLLLLLLLLLRPCVAGSCSSRITAHKFGKLRKGVSFGGKEDSRAPRCCLPDLQLLIFDDGVALVERLGSVRCGMMAGEQRAALP